jgi:hypothetical protein
MKTYQDDETEHLRRVLEKASDVILARHDKRFARLNGGVRKLTDELQQSVYEAQEFYDSHSID